MSLDQSAKVAGIIRDAGGRIVGRTRLQKIAYLLTVAGLEDGLAFAYKHYGPYSEDLANAAVLAGIFGDVREVEHRTGWGGTYSVFTVEGPIASSPSQPRQLLAKMAADADAVELELAATAVFLAIEGYKDPWAETVRRKPEKSEAGKIDRARALFSKLSSVSTPNRLPAIG